MQLFNNKNKAFTLVELIVVVTILAILWTIGFVSYSSYLSWVRDANRTSSLQSISDGLQLSSTRWVLPTPDNFINITSGGETIWYQGDAGTTVLEIIDYSKAWLDPKDKIPFTYYLSENKRYHQLMAFLEESHSLQSYNVLFPQANAALDLSNRYPIFYGKKLWILTDPVTFIPSHDSDVDIDLSTTANTYAIHLAEEQYITGDNTELFQFSSLPERWGRGYSIDSTGRLIYINLDLWVSRTGLVWEYHFDGNFNDSSGLWNHGTVVWATETYIDWKIAEAMTITTSPYGIVSYDSGSELDITTDEFTISVWFKSPSISWQILNNYSFGVWGYWVEMNSGPWNIHTRYCWSSTCTSRVMSFPDTFDSSKYYSYITTYDGVDLKIYLDGILLVDTPATHIMDVSWRTTMAIPWSSFEWQVDQARIYNRALSRSEVGLLFDE